MCIQYAPHYVALDQMIADINGFVTNDFYVDIIQRIQRKTNPAIQAIFNDDNTLLWKMANIIAYSNAAQADAVAAMMVRGTFDMAFGNLGFHHGNRSFDVQFVAALVANNILAQYWPNQGDDYVTRQTQRIGALGIAGKKKS